MAKFHIKENGEPGECHAQEGNCPRGGESGSDNHFNTQEEAQAYADKKNVEEYGLTSTLNKRKRVKVNWDSEYEDELRENIEDDLGNSGKITYFVEYRDELSEEDLDRIMSGDEGYFDAQEDFYNRIVDYEYSSNFYDEEIGSRYYHDEGARQYLANNGYDEEELEEMNEEEFGEAIRETTGLNVVNAMDLDEPMRQMARNSGSQLMRTELGSFEGVDETEASDYIADKLKAHGIKDTPELRENIEELLDNGTPYGLHDGVHLEVYYRSDVSDHIRNAERKISVEEPYVAIFDSGNGTGHDVKLSGETFSAEVGGDRELTVKREENRRGYSWTETAGLYTPAYPEANVKND